MVERRVRRPQAWRALRFRLTTGEAILEIRSGTGAGLVRVESQTRYVVVPDYFGDDMVFGVDRFREFYLPAENFCLHLLEGGDAMIMSVWQSSEQDVWLAGAKSGKGGALSSSRIRCSTGEKHLAGVPRSAGHLARCPGIGQRRSRPLPRSGAAVWSGETGWLIRGTWIRGSAPAAAAGKQAGRCPVLVYPIDRSPATPLTTTCPTDVMRNTLGVGPASTSWPARAWPRRAIPRPTA